MAWKKLKFREFEKTQHFIRQREIWISIKRKTRFISLFYINLSDVLTLSQCRIVWQTRKCSFNLLCILFIIILHIVLLQIFSVSSSLPKLIACGCFPIISISRIILCLLYFFCILYSNEHQIQRERNKNYCIELHIYLLSVLLLKFRLDFWVSSEREDDDR